MGGARGQMPLTKLCLPSIIGWLLTGRCGILQCVTMHNFTSTLLHLKFQKTVTNGDNPEPVTTKQEGASPPATTDHHLVLILWHSVGPQYPPQVYVYACKNADFDVDFSKKNFGKQSPPDLQTAETTLIPTLKILASSLHGTIIIKWHTILQQQSVTARRKLTLKCEEHHTINIANTFQRHSL